MNEGTLYCDANCSQGYVKSGDVFYGLPPIVKKFRPQVMKCFSKMGTLEK